MSALSFQPSTVTKSLRSGLTERANDVITSRYGLGSSDESETLESIGERYEITRERVRQIEADALRQMRESDTFENQQEAFSELEDLFHDLGILLREDTFLQNVSNRTSPKTTYSCFWILTVGSVVSGPMIIFITAGMWISEWLQRSTKHSRTYTIPCLLTS